MESLHANCTQESEDDLLADTKETNYCIKGYDYMSA